MTNKEKYKNTFAILQTSATFDLEADKMEMLKRKAIYKRIATTIIVLFLLATVSGTVYASDIGGLRTRMKLWIHGSEEDTTVEYHDNGDYIIEYTDKDGNQQVTTGAIYKIDKDGNNQALDDDKFVHYLTEPRVYRVDGKITVEYKDEVVDITDQFKYGVCTVRFHEENGTWNIKVKEQEERYLIWFIDKKDSCSSLSESPTSDDMPRFNDYQYKPE